MEICYVPPIFCSVMRMLIFLFYFILSVSSFVVSTFQLSNRPSNVSDQEALLGFMSAISEEYDASHSLSTTWKPNVSFCQWEGIRCSRRRQRVVSLNVSNMGLQGTISPLLGNLSFLRILDLSNNSFHGHIPDQLGSLFRLKLLRLSRNLLHGSIPISLGGCRSLQNLSMANNILVGNIPSELCILPKLQNLSLHDNNLTGTLPACLGNISSLEDINFCRNNLHGSLPSELGMLSQLRVISLCQNNLTGQIPSSLSNCTSLQLLFVSINQLTGHLPEELCSKNAPLTGLYLSVNQFSGSIPASLFNCTELRNLELSYNQLSGVVPMELGKLTQLELLNLGENQLVSSTKKLSFLDALTNCSTLLEIDLNNNYLTGHLPYSLGHLSTKLNYRNWGFNALAGEIPPQLGNLTSLTVIALHNNMFTGSIPSSFNMLSNLVQLYLSTNNLQGNIPMGIWQLKSLGLLELGVNNLQGRIPESVGNLQQLRYLDLSYNRLSGNIPVNLEKCKNLLLLDLSYNRLSGYIPHQVAGLANLALYLNLSNNFVHGPLPSEIGKMTMVQVIDISSNRISGYIPSVLQYCKGLEFLNLSRNAFEGPIPASLSELQSLLNMDFSSNNLSGGIPMSLQNLKMLHHLNFSFNKLSGAVPRGGVFKKLGATAFMGNLGLCGSWVSLPPCSIHKHKSVLHMKRVIIPLVIAAVIVVSCLFVGFLWKQKHKMHVSTKVGVAYQRISFEELIIATDDFNDANLLGVGSFGKVYKGILNDGTIIAVKLLNLENEGAHKIFDKECKVLGRVRHRNLIRIITSFSNLQMKALIFPFMPNGSLEKWLYPNGEEESGLSLIQRLNIAIDIAQGMAYLHHYCFIQVIHCDLKPNNVLLGEDMTAYLIDFGIATICFANSKDSAFTSTHALKGSPGYIPPEYGLGGRVTTKGDVYSYGIVLLEMLTGKKPTHTMFVEGMNLQRWVSSSFPDHIEEVVDGSLLRRTSTIAERDKELHCLNQLLSLGLFSTKESPERRPTMINIVSQLQSVKDTFLGTARVPKFQSDMTHLLGSTNTLHNICDEDQSSSTS